MNLHRSLPHYMYKSELPKQIMMLCAVPDLDKEIIAFPEIIENLFVEMVRLSCNYR
jgi:hypothetical protein